MVFRETIRSNGSSKQSAAQNSTSAAIAFDLNPIERPHLPQDSGMGVHGSNGLLMYLFSKGDGDYKYELRPSEEIANPFYRERNFR